MLRETGEDLKKIGLGLVKNPKFLLLGGFWKKKSVHPVLGIHWEIGFFR